MTALFVEFIQIVSESIYYMNRKFSLESAVTICKSNDQSEQNQKLLNKESNVHVLHKTYNKLVHKYGEYHGKQASKSEVANQIKTQYKSNNIDISNSVQLWNNSCTL